MTALAPMRLASVVTAAGECHGFLLRIYSGFRAFNADEIEIGTFANQEDAVMAILDHKPAGAP